MASSRPRPQVIRLTEAAADRIKYVMANAANPVVGVRVGVKNGGCAGMTYTMEYAEKVEPADELVEDKGVRVLIDPKAILFLLGTEMDYKADRKSTRLNSSHTVISYAVFCLKKKKKKRELQSHRELVCRLLIEKKNIDMECRTMDRHSASARSRVSRREHKSAAKSITRSRAR